MNTAEWIHPVTLAAFVASGAYLIQILYSIWFIYSFYVDKRRKSVEYKFFFLFGFMGESDQDDYIQDSMWGIFLSFLMSGIIFVFGIVVLTVFYTIPYIFLSTVGGIALLVVIAKVHRAVNNVRYNLKDHVEDNTVHR